jgi:hypothetical protein
MSRRSESNRRDQQAESAATAEAEDPVTGTGTPRRPRHLRAMTRSSPSTRYHTCCQQLLNAARQRSYGNHMLSLIAIARSASYFTSAGLRDSADGGRSTVENIEGRRVTVAASGEVSPHGRSAGELCQVPTCRLTQCTAIMGANRPSAVGGGVAVCGERESSRNLEQKPPATRKLLMKGRSPRLCRRHACQSVPAVRHTLSREHSGNIVARTSARSWI